MNSATDNHIECNFIGTDVSGMLARANSGGVNVANGANNNTIGGVFNGTGRNLISGNSDYTTPGGQSNDLSALVTITVGIPPTISCCW